MTRLAHLACIAMAAAAVGLAASCENASRGPSIVLAGIEAENCASFCVDTISAALYRSGDEIPLGPVRTVSCGESIEFDQIPAGQRVFARVAALRNGTEPVLEGRSDEVTIVVDDAVALPVELGALAAPRLDRINPDPIVRLDDGEGMLALTGSAFGRGEGAFGVEVDGLPLPLDESTWTDTAIDIPLPGNVKGTRLRVRNCGVASDEMRLRILGKTLSSQMFQPVGCPGLSFVDAAPIHGTPDIALAVSCDKPDDCFIQRFMSQECTLLGSLKEHSLPDRPRAVAVDHEGVAWIALETGGIASLPVSPGNPARDARSIADDIAFHRVAISGGQVWAISEHDLHRVREGSLETITGFSSDLDPVDLASGDDTLIVLSRHRHGGGWLVFVSPDTGSIAQWNLQDCPEPLRVTKGGTDTIAVTCGGDRPGLCIVRPSPQEVRLASPGMEINCLDLEDLPGPVALDEMGDVAFIWDGASKRLAAFGLLEMKELAGWDMDGPGQQSMLVRLPGDHRLLLAGPGTGRMVLIDPYGVGNPCDSSRM